MITNQQLVQFAISTLGKPYMYGNNGWIITEKLIQDTAERLPKHYNDSKINHLRKSIGLPGYQCNSYLSIMLKKERTSNSWRDYGYGGTIETIPELPGICVFYEGHTGVYIGNGKVLEARGTFYGVVITKLKERPWKVWRKFKEIEYLEDEYMILKIDSKDTVKGGLCGTAVYEWQTSLMCLGIKMVNNNLEYGADGSYGKATANGTKAFQKKEGLAQSGEVDYQTLGLMIKRIREINLHPLNELKKAINTIKEVINKC